MDTLFQNPPLLAATIVIAGFRHAFDRDLRRDSRDPETRSTARIDRLEARPNGPAERVAGIEGGSWGPTPALRG